LQGHKRIIDIDVGQIGHALLLDQIAQAGHHSHETRNDLVEQALQFSASGRARFLEFRFCLGAPIDPVEHQTMQMDVQIGGRSAR